MTEWHRIPDNPPSPAPRCQAVGAILVRGVEVAAIRCTLEDGHDRPSCVIRYLHACYLTGYRGADAWACAPIEATPHAHTITWADPVPASWPEAFDPTESFDVEIPVDESRG